MPARDVFLCHAHVDKVSYTAPLAGELNRRGISCWVDEGEILPGRSLIDAINDGIRSARYVLILVTSAFLEPGWRQRELNAALSREIRTGSTIVIPILDIDHDRFADQYPLLGDKLSLDWRDGISTVADQVSHLFPRSASTDWHYDHPQDYIGLIWVRVLPVAHRCGQQHQLTLRWGPYIKTETFTAPIIGPVSFSHHKMAPDNITLHASVIPAAILTFGQGASPDRPPINVDEGWTRTSGGEWAGNL